MSYLRFVIIAALLILRPGLGISGTFAEELHGPTRSVGKLFTVTVTPGSKKIEVQVVGNTVGEVQFKDVDLAATITVAKRQWVIQPEKKNGSFILEAPSDMPANAQPQLKLEIDSKTGKEKFDLKLNTVKP